MAGRSSALFAPAFALAYCALYAAKRPVFLYYPLHRELALERLPESHGPAMHWYGWLTAGLVAGVVAVLLVPPRWCRARAARRFLADRAGGHGADRVGGTAGVPGPMHSSGFQQASGIDQQRRARDELAGIETTVERSVGEAVDFARPSPHPGPASVHDHLYSNPIGEPA